MQSPGVAFSPRLAPEALPPGALDHFRPLPRRHRDGRRGWAAPLAILLAAAFAIRLSQFGNPLIHVDEGFYLLVGDRMLHGALPYVDIWDRKPIGLFLVYAAIRLLGGDGILAYQAVATLFAGATAFVIQRVAARMAGQAAAVMAGITYLLLLGFAGGMGGQSPVFYNLFVALAALATLDACERPDLPPRALWGRGAVAMALVGIAMQIKYSAVFEGVFLGLVLLRQAHRALPGWRRLVAPAAGWIALALLPTLLALAWYVAIGQGEAFVFANFVSIFGRHGDDAAQLGKRLEDVALVLALPVALVLLAGRYGTQAGRPGRRIAFAFVQAWIAAALFGFAVFGSYFDHYMLPLFAPLAAGAAPLFDRRGALGLGAAALVLVAGTGGYAIAVRNNQVRRGGEPAMERMVAAIRPRLAGCLFVYDGYAILYHLTGSCIPTRYAFPEHLTLRRENGSVGAAPLAEVARVMAGRPSVVVDTVEKDESDENPDTNRLVRAILARDYRLVESVARRKGTTLIYARRPGVTGMLAAVS